MGSGTESIGAKAPPDLVERVEEYKEKHDLSKSEVVRQSIRTGLDVLELQDESETVEDRLEAIERVGGLPSEQEGDIEERLKTVERNLGMQPTTYLFAETFWEASAPEKATMISGALVLILGTLAGIGLSVSLVFLGGPGGPETIWTKIFGGMFTLGFIGTVLFALLFAGLVAYLLGREAVRWIQSLGTSGKAEESG